MGPSSSSEKKKLGKNEETSSRDGESKKSKSRVQLTRKTQELLGLSVFQSSFKIDLARLSSRISITKNGLTTEFENVLDPRDRLVKIVLQIVEQLESPSTLKKVQEYCQKENGSDHYLLEGILKIVDDNSDSACVFNCLTQDIVAEPATLIKTSVFEATNSLTRDDSSKDGWKINISFINDELVVITHSRKELSMDLTPKSGYSFVWEFQIHFDLQTFKLLKTELEIKDIQIFDPSKKMIEVLRNV